MMDGADVKFSIEQDGCLAEVVIPVEIMRELHLELAADYLVMAATLAEIK
jgi:hypothetical protein